MNDLMSWERSLPLDVLVGPDDPAEDLHLMVCEACGRTIPDGAAWVIEDPASGAVELLCALCGALPEGVPHD